MRNLLPLYYIFKGEIVKEYTEIKHYGFNYIIGLINATILCYILIEGFYTEDSNFTDFLVKFFIWYVGRDLISEMAVGLSDEKRQGTLEYIYLNISRLEYFLLIKGFSTLLWSIIFYIVLAVALIFFNFFDREGMMLSISFNEIFLITNALIACMGFGYFFSGLSLIFRKVGSFVSVFGYLLLFSQFIDTNSSYFNFFTFIPGAWYRMNLDISTTFLYALSTLVIGILTFVISLKLSLKGGYFWRV